MYGRIGPGAILQIGMSLEDDDEFVAEFREIFGATLAVVMALAALLGWFMARGALKNVEEVTRTARAIREAISNNGFRLKARQTKSIDWRRLLMTCSTAFRRSLPRPKR